MKKILFYMLTAFLSALLLYSIPVSGEEELYSNVIRLHVLANSDSDEDQKLKLEVRDYVLETYKTDLQGFLSVEEADSALKENLEKIEQSAEDFVKSKGYDYCVSVTLGDEEYPKTDYDGFSFPAGTYRSLRIVIGEGAGHNWWCVLFPPMCVESSTGDVIDYSDVEVGLTEPQYRMISQNQSKKYAVKFKILELLEENFK